LKSDSVPGQIS